MKTFLRAFAVLAVLASAAIVAAQGTEVETNHPCPSAQNLGTPALPFTLSGALDALLTEGDVDFYRFQGTAGTGIQVDLEGQDAGVGTLRDPLLGMFDSSCQFLRLDDDSNFRDSRLLTTIPPDGVLVFAVSACCDSSFQGEVGVGGSYRLSIRSASLVHSIHGRVVSAATGEPFDSGFPFPHVTLYRCAGSQCDDWVNSDFPSSDGVFLFETDQSGNPLFAGTYQVRVSALHHQDAESLPFAVAEGEERDLGDIALVAFARIGTVAGRLLDAISSNPLSGVDPPFARAELKRCDDFGCFFADSSSPDDQGRFVFGEDPFRLLEPGTYQIEASANEYRPVETARFLVGEGDDVAVDDIRITPFPVGFSEIRPCGNLPQQGGLCRFSLRVVNRIDRPIDGAAWSLVRSFATGSLSDETNFQAGAPRGLRLPPRASKVVRFSFRVPASVRNGSFTCAEVYFGQGRSGFFFDTIGHRDVFCIEKGLTGALRMVDDKRAREFMRERETSRRPGTGKKVP